MITGIILFSCASLVTYIIIQMTKNNTFPLIHKKYQPIGKDEALDKRNAQAREYMNIIMNGTATPEQIHKFGEKKQRVEL